MMNQYKYMCIIIPQ